MSKLALYEIFKSYKAGDIFSRALRGVTLSFREHEFVAVLGPSGCGKTTLLNVIGGLDHYDSGDLVIGGLSTVEYRDADWDAYRNRQVGFVFQNYNLIGHQSVLRNVEIAMTLSGVPAGERRRRAMAALESVGLEGEAHKRPSQLSGGQMQRVAIARALVNEPDILLADEPTGALDSQTSVQVMEILKKISEDRLVILVTHNARLAQQYSTRIVELLDGEVVSDSNPIEESGDREQAAGGTKREARSRKPEKKTSMSFGTAVSLSLNNLLTKRGRTVITAFAGSIGIIGVALVLALSSGLSGYMDKMQSGMLSSLPVSISTGPQRIDRDEQQRGVSERINRNRLRRRQAEEDKFPAGETIFSHDPNANLVLHTNLLSEEFLRYIEGMRTLLPGAVNHITYSRGLQLNVLVKGGEEVRRFSTGSGGGMAAMIGRGGSWQELPGNDAFIMEFYDLLEGRLPAAENEIVLVVDTRNRLRKSFLEQIGLPADRDYEFGDFIGKAIVKVIPNDVFYVPNGDLYREANPADYSALFEHEAGIPLVITGVLRERPDAVTGFLSQGFAYTPALMEAMAADAANSEIARAQLASGRDVFYGLLDEDEVEKVLQRLGARNVPTGISIFPIDFDGKDRITQYLNDWNDGRPEEEQIFYSVLADQIAEATGTLLGTITYVLVGFAAISLVVSTIMIGIITYVSVLERTKEIGILRSVGARKRDVGSVFNAETFIIGAAAGLLGVGVALLLTVPINAIIYDLVELQGIAALRPLHGVALIAGSMGLTLVAGLIPARVAARKDPVEALRAE